MKNKASRTLTLTKPTDDDIREYAYHLYQQSNCVPGRDLDNWLEATACLNANITLHQAATRLHEHVKRLDREEP